MPQHLSVIKVRQEYRIFCFACADPFALIHYVQLQFTVHLGDSYTQLLTVKQLEIQAESERLLANARSLLEVASSPTFSIL